ncbi:MAG: hypothetical protein WC417_02480 [Candidatus Omnitrophota bacterium]
MIETLVSTLIFTVIAMGIFLVMTVAQRSWFSGDAAVEVRQQLIIALITMNRELSETTSGKTDLTADTPKASITFSIPHDNNGDGRIIDDDGKIEWSEPITYYRDASNNLLRTFGGAVSIMAHDISSLQFINTENKLIQVDIKAEKIDGMGKLTRDVERAIIKMRN